MKNLGNGLSDKLNQCIDGLEEDLVKLNQKNCPYCGSKYNGKRKICPVCSHTLEGVIRKYQIESRSRGFYFQLKMIGCTTLVFISFFVCIGMISLASYLFGGVGLSLTLGIITFFLCYLLFGRVKPVVKEIDHADDYIKRVIVR